MVAENYFYSRAHKIICKIVCCRETRSSYEADGRVFQKYTLLYI